MSTAKMCKALLLSLTLFTALSTTFGQTAVRPIRIGVLDFGTSSTAQRSAEHLRANLKTATQIALSDSELARAAAKGIGYSGSLNLSTVEARDLGAALDVDYYVLGDAQTLRRSSSQAPTYFESYCSLFVVSSHTGQLLFWDRLSYQDNAEDKAQQLLLRKLQSNELRQKFLDAILRAFEDERAQRSILVDINQPLLEAPDDEKMAEAAGLRMPRPYQRLRPEYPVSAARAEAQATVDVIVDVDRDGEVGQVQIARWGGFGLDEVTIATVKQMHFFPAQQNGAPVAMRVLLRYNFRKTQN